MVISFYEFTEQSKRKWLQHWLQQWKHFLQIFTINWKSSFGKVPSRLNIWEEELLIEKLPQFYYQVRSVFKRFSFSYPSTYFKLIHIAISIYGSLHSTMHIDIVNHFRHTVEPFISSFWSEFVVSSGGELCLENDPCHSDYLVIQVNKFSQLPVLLSV